MAPTTGVGKKKPLHPLVTISLIIGALVVATLLVWQGVTTNGTPDPTTPHTSTLVAILDIAALVFREGLECTLVLTAVTASLQGGNRSYQRPIAFGAGLG